MTYDQKELDALFLRAKEVLGPEASREIVSAKPRCDAFCTAMARATKAMGGPNNVTDEQILGALEIAHEVFPLELEVITKAFYSKPKD